MSDLDRLDDLMTLDEAAERWQGRFSIEELKRAARGQELPHIRKGRKRLTTEAWLREWLLQNRVGPWPNERDRQRGASSSGDTGSIDMSEAPGSTSTGMTDEQEESAADLLAQKISRKRKSGSPRTS